MFLYLYLSLYHYFCIHFDNVDMWQVENCDMIPDADDGVIAIDIVI